jgi:hypothetical protein
MDSSTFLSTSYSKEDEVVPPTADAGEDVLAILGYVKSNPSHSTSRGDTGPGDRILNLFCRGHSMHKRCPKNVSSM